MIKAGKILLIENQYCQFKIIRDYLSNATYDVFPNRDSCEFKSFIDLIRIYLNQRYGGLNENSRRMRVFEKMCKEISDFDPSLLIIDHVLVGNHEAHNGLFLAKKLRDKKINIPIMFLSRTQENDIEVLENIHNIEDPKIWISKGYSGQNILDTTYFNKHVIDEIPKLMRMSSFDEVRIKIENILKWNIFNDDIYLTSLRDLLTSIINVGYCNEIIERYIREFEPTADVNQRKYFYNNIKNNLSQEL